MPQIIPIKDLKNTSEISEMCHRTEEPIYVTKNGYGDMVIMSMESYEQNRYDSMVYDKLREAELQAASTKERVSHEDVMAKARERICAAEEKKRA